MNGRKSINLAQVIAQNWHKGLNLEYRNVDFGVAMTYDILQIVNRTIIRERERKHKQASVANDSGTDLASPVAAVG